MKKEGGKELKNTSPGPEDAALEKAKRLESWIGQDEARTTLSCPC